MGDRRSVLCDVAKDMIFFSCWIDAVRPDIQLGADLYTGLDACAALAAARSHEAV